MKRIFELCVFVLSVLGKSAVTVEESKLPTGALVRLATPETWKGQVAFLAHGYMPEDYPLYAYFGLEDEPQKTLLDAGWAVASSSYRRNGPIVADAMDDMMDLVSWVEGKLGEPKTQILVGGSMGGAITARLLEAQPGEFDGAFIMSNAIYFKEDGNPLAPIQHQPGVPVVLLTNVDEVAVPRAYATVAGAQGGLEPLLLIVGREGHMAYNEVEYAQAVGALMTWLETGERPVLGEDVTAETEEPASTSVFTDGAASNEIIRIDPVYGNFVGGFTPSDMAQLGLEVGDKFTLTVDGAQHEITYGTTYSDVPVGDWVAFVSQNKRILFCINFGQAARALGLEIGDVLSLARVD